MQERHESTSQRVARIAAKGAKRPQSLSLDEIQTVCASALTQARSRRSLLDKILGRDVAK